MSINVTVHGNPISIKRGKMVALDSEKEFALRRKIRLQQVRQQSKEIAEDVRNKVRNEKRKQLSKATKAAEKCLNKKKDEMLSSLNRQYQNCLEQFGEAYKNAESEIDPEEVMEQIKKYNRGRAENRGKLANENARRMKDEETENSKKLDECRKIAQNVEKARAKLVSNIHRSKKSPFKPKKRRKISNTSITINGVSEVVSDDSTNTDDIDLDNLSVIEEISVESDPEKSSNHPSINLGNLASSSSTTESDDKIIWDLNVHSSTTKYSNGTQSCASFASHEQRQNIPSNSNLEKRSEKWGVCAGGQQIKSTHLDVEYEKLFDNYLTRIPENCACTSPKNKPKKTISSKDKKNKMRVSLSSKKENVYPKTPTSPRKRLSPRRTNISSRPISPIRPSYSEQEQLPYVPTLTVRPESPRMQESSTKYYDRFNCYNIEQPQRTVVQKISKDSLEVLPSDNEEVIHREKLKKQTIDAKLRGGKALEKQRIHHDYQQLMQELPVLKRQEQLSAMLKNQQKLHMSEARLLQREREKQNRMENAFEKTQTTPYTPLITLKPTKKLPPPSDIKEPFKTLDVTTNSLNVGRWEQVLETGKSFVSESAGESSPSESQTAVNDEKAITELLRRVNKQRSLLLKEVANLPSLVNLKKVLNEQELLDLICKQPTQSPQLKVLKETATSPLVMKPASEKGKGKKKAESSRSSSKRTASSSDTSSEALQKKVEKKKSKKLVKRQKVLIKEEGTQTSPANKTSTKASDNKEEATQTTPFYPNKLSPKPIVTSEYPVQVPDLSLNNLSSGSDKVEIIIRASEDKSVQISHRSVGTTDKKTKSTNTEKVFNRKPSNVVIKIREPESKKEKKVTEISTGTSYQSLPVETSRSKSISNKELLGPQKQQTNFNQLVQIDENDGTKEINPRLFRYIKKLLGMSRQSIDDLTVSSISEVSTPHESVVQIASNQAREKLQSVMQHFNLTPEDIKRYYISSSTLSTTDISLENEIQEIMKPTMLLSSDEKSFPQDIDPSIGKNIYSSGSVSENEIIANQHEVSPPRPSSPPYGARRPPPPLRLQSPQPSTSKGVKSISPRATNDYIDDAIRSRPVNRKQFSRVDGTDRFTTIQSKSPDRELEQRQKSVKHVKEIRSFSLDESRKSPTFREEPVISPRDTKLRSPIKSSIRREPSPRRDRAGASSVETWQQPEQFLQFVRETLGVSVEEFNNLGFQDLFAQHTELSEYCHERIKSLMDLIDKVRNDKITLGSLSPDDPASITLTSYLELPESKKPPVEQEKSSSSSSISQEALDKYLLGIEKDPIPPTKTKKHKEKVNFDVSQGNKFVSDNPETFVPMLQGIPKYGEGVSAAPYVSQIIQKIKPKPPPSLARANMRGYVDVMPHELSTIVEADTMASSKNTSVHSPKKNEHRVVLDVVDRKTIEGELIEKPSEESPQLSNASGDYVTITPDRIVDLDKSEIKGKQVVVLKSPEQKKTSPKSTPTNQDPMIDSTKSNISGVQPLSDSNSSPDELESLLRKFKLDWAISLVRKTEQALALSSSSSTSELDSKFKSSDVSITELYRQLYQKLASSSGSEIDKSQILSDLSSHFRDLNDLSRIQSTTTGLKAESRTDSRNKSQQQRTSTPVQISHSSESFSKEVMFKGDSEISSVRNSSEENMFLSIPNLTLNTTNCSLNKTKK